jgi:DNA topoisomerase I
MLRKQKKSKEEKTVENYFPISEDNLKYSIKKEYSHPEYSNIEKIIKKSPKKRISKKTNKKNNLKDYSPPKISLKKSGYELIITEKPQAALKIASSLGNSKKNNLKGVPYYELSRNNQKIIVACAVGHLFTLKQLKNSSYDSPIFDIKWFPNFMVRKKDFTKKYYETILSLVKKAKSVTIATDYDIEGEVIGLNIVRYICNQKDASRMKFSTLTKSEINESYEKKSNSLNWGQAIAGETRHYLDWFYGINLSRALMNSMKSIGKFRIMSIGRVQGPTLNLIVNKEQKIKKFKPEPYWQVFITISDKKNEVELKHNKDIFDKNILEQFKSIKNKTAKAKTAKKLQKIPPKAPFDLTTLQIEAYKIYGITPSETLRNAQSLYLSGLISYPRTSSQKLPESIDYKSILEKLAKEFNVEHLIKKSKPIEGKKSDPAHPSIYPTAQYDSSPILAGNEEKIYNLIVRRFLSLFCEEAIVNKKTITAEINSLKFSDSGDSIVKKSWLEIYPSKIKEKFLPDMNGNVEIIKIREEEKETQPPKRYSQASIISKLEKKNLGTKATRSTIIETLYDREYVREKSIEATPLGISLIETLEKYSPIILDETLTRNFEKEMESIQNSKDNLKEKQSKIIKKAKEIINEILEDFKKNKEKIGKNLSNANNEYREQQKIENKLMVCPKCKKGNLAITYSKKNKRYFIACDAYPDCTNTYTLPPNGIIKKTDKICEDCGFPMLMRLTKGKRPWIFCFNPECSKNKERIEEYKKNKKTS